jgi:hypothetical protein
MTRHGGAVATARSAVRRMQNLGSVSLSPAMAAGISDTLWSMTDLAIMINAAQPKLGKRGAYKGRGTMSDAIVFTLKPADSEIPDLIHRYHEDLDKDCFAAGTRIRNGDLSKENLRVIYRWKMQSFSYLGQEQKYFDKNSDETVASVLRATIEAIDKHGDTERAFHELQSLKGIGLPVASAILTAVFPDRFRWGRAADDHWTNSPSSGQHTAHYLPVMIAPFLDQFIEMASMAWSTLRRADWVRNDPSPYHHTVPGCYATQIQYCRGVLPRMLGVLLERGGH